MKKTRILTLLLLIICISTIQTTPRTNSSPTPNILIDAPTLIQTGTYLTIKINITDVNQLAAWQLTLYYNNSLLNGTITAEGPFLKQAGPTFYWQVQFTDHYNETHGIAELTCTIIGETGGANGTGTLATITFKTIGEGNATLHLENTKLSDPQGKPINHTTTDATVQIYAASDIAILNVNPAKTIVGQGYSMDINVTVENQGTTAETFNLTVYANTSEIETKQITLESNASTTITFTWDTAGFAKGNYTITAYAWPVPGEADTADNTYTDNFVTVTIMGDVDGNFEVDIFDITYICVVYDKRMGEPGYVPNCDVNSDGIIDIFDVTTACITYGQKDP